MAESTVRRRLSYFRRTSRAAYNGGVKSQSWIPSTSQLGKSRGTKTAIRILVVDDDEAIRTLLAELFCEEGYQVQTAGHGRQALDVIRGSPFDVILSDMSMPVMD